MDLDELLRILGDECRLVTGASSGVAEDAFAHPTRLPAWNVKELIAHMWRDVDRIRTGLATESTAPPDTDAVSYWRSYEPATDGPATADRAKEVAARFGTGADLVADFEANWREGIAAASAVSPERPLTTWGPTLRLDDFLRTRILEIGVHGLDLADAIGAEPWLTDGGAAVTREILTGLLGSDPPVALGWSDRSFIEAGTGRRGLAYAERSILGPRANSFPLLG